MKNLDLLCLLDRPVDDAAVKNLKGMKLKVLNLSLTQITDRALDDIKEMTTLEQLYVGGTKVTEPAIIRLKAVKPLKINDDQWIESNMVGRRQEMKKSRYNRAVKAAFLLRGQQQDREGRFP